MQKFFRIAFLSCFIFCGLLALPKIKSSIAATEWALYVSDTELFSVMFPGKPDEIFSTFRLGDGLVLHTSEALSFIDQRPYKDIVKNYVVKFDQTFGPAISTDYQVKIVERELKLYEKSYKDRDAKVIDRSISGNTENTIGELSLVYDDFEQGMQAVRIKILITKTSKFHQIFSGPEKNLDSTLTHKYFNSLNVESGVVSKSGNMNEEWRRIESPLSLFAVKIPPINPPYFINEPSVKKDGKTERIGMVFTDPIWAQNLFYSITGYQLDSEMSFELAKDALLEKHLRRHGRNEVGISFHKDFIGETPYIQTHYAINPPKGYPYLNKVRLRALFLGNYMIVQEVVGPNHLVETEFTESFFNLIEFTPKKAFQKELQRHLQAAGSSARPAE